MMLPGLWTTRLWECRPWLDAWGNPRVTAVEPDGRQIKMSTYDRAVLTPDEWGQLDALVERNFAEGCPVARGLIAEKRVVRIGDALERRIVERLIEREGGLFTLVGHPLPFCHCAASIDIRSVALSRRRGGGLIDFTQVEAAARHVGREVDAGLAAMGIFTTTDSGKMLIGLDPITLYLCDHFEVAAIMIPVPEDFEGPQPRVAECRPLQESPGGGV
jgi:hypothetical protein